MVNRKPHAPLPGPVLTGSWVGVPDGLGGVEPRSHATLLALTRAALREPDLPIAQLPPRLARTLAAAAAPVCTAVSEYQVPR